ncbi:MAG TPA: hypothetical protein DCR14_16590 [Acidimicrobiaceae bacterium]|nr:hypothetical protein [Acidimicrobiaceae bacterium]
MPTPPSQDCGIQPWLSRKYCHEAKQPHPKWERRKGYAESHSRDDQRHQQPWVTAAFSRLR